MSYSLIEPSAVIAVPSHVQMCPYCGAGLVCQFSAWTEDGEGGWMAESIELECVSEPELDEELDASLETWDEWFSRHSDMPYVYWLPATLVVEKWINERFRFRMDE